MWVLTLASVTAMHAPVSFHLDTIRSLFLFFCPVNSCPGPTMCLIYRYFWAQFSTVRVASFIQKKSLVFGRCSGVSWGVVYCYDFFFLCLDLSLTFSLQVYNKPCSPFFLQELWHIHTSVVHALTASRLSLRTTSWRSRLLLPDSSYLSCFLLKPGGRVLPWRVTPECSLHVLWPETFNTELRFLRQDSFLSMV